MVVRTTPPIIPTAPQLPVAPEQYGKQDSDKYSNVLRLYFNQLNNFTQLLTTNTGGSELGFPFVSASDSNTQYATADNTATIVQWNTLDAGNAFTLNTNYIATASVTGIYKITYSLQFANNDNAIHDAIVWLRVDGTSATSLNDVANSTTIFKIGRAHV